MNTESDRKLLREARERRDILGLQALSPLSSAYLPWTVSSMRPSGVAAVLNEILVNRRRTIVELGGGISTCFIARLLSRLNGGHLWTVEHDERWADFLESQLTSEGLQQFVTVVRASLEPVDSNWPGEENAWYQRKKLNTVLAGQSFDLLLIDGPPAYQAEWTHARYPAVPFFAPLLADDYAVILDDVDRAGEQDIMKRWESEFDIKFQSRLIDGVIGIGRPRPAFTI